MEESRKNLLEDISEIGKKIKRKRAHIFNLKKRKEALEKNILREQTRLREFQGKKKTLKESLKLLEEESFTSIIEMETG